MDHFGPLIAIIGSLFGIIVIIAAAVASARASFAKAQIEALRGDRDDLIERVNILEAAKDRQERELKTERDKVRVLERVVTGKEQLDRIETTLGNNQKALVKWQEEQAGRAQAILDIVKKIRGGAREGDSHESRHTGQRPPHE